MCFTSVLMFCALQIFPFAHLFSQVFFPSVLHTLTLEGALGDQVYSTHESSSFHQDF